MLLVHPKELSRSAPKLSPKAGLTRTGPACLLVAAVLSGCSGEAGGVSNSNDTTSGVGGVSTTVGSSSTGPETSGASSSSATTGFGGGSTSVTSTSGAGAAATSASGGATSNGGVSSTSATSGACTNVRPSGTDRDDASCDDWATQTEECEQAWMIDAGYCNESCGRCEPGGQLGGPGAGGASSVSSSSMSSSTGGGGSGNTACQATGFYVEGGSVYDVNCNEFVMRGVNVPHAWFAGNTQGALGDAASVGANTVRVVLATGGQWSRTNGSTVANIIAWAKDNQLVAMLEVHDSTGYGESAGAVHPDDAIDYWTSQDVLGAIAGEEAYVMINIANEPFGNSHSSEWSSFHQNAVQTLRAAGIGHLLVVDAPNWGQDWEELMRNDTGGAASSIIAADPHHNVLFSVHMYDVYSAANVVTSYIDTFLGHGLALVVGEFAADHGAGTNVDEGTIMAKAESSRIGYIGWSWSGNGGDLGSLDITSNFNVNSLTPWGSTLINGPLGIAETAQTCSCFE